MNLKLIANLRTDVDTLKSTISEKNLEIQSLRSELLSVKGASDQKSIDNSKLRKELDIMAENEAINDTERSKMDEMIQSLKQEKRQLLGELDNINELFSDEMNKTRDLEKIVEDLLEVKKLNEFQNNELRNSLENAEKALQEANRSINILEIEAKNNNKDAEQTHEEIVYLKKSLEKEMSNSRELNGKVSTLETTLR